jgi:hypothetical protein
MSLSTSLKSRTSDRSALSEMRFKKEPEILEKNANIPPAAHTFSTQSSLTYMPTAVSPTSSASAGAAGSLPESSRPRRSARGAAVDVHASGFESASFQQGLKRERQSLDPSSNSKIPKAEPLEYDIKMGTSGEADSEVQRLKKYQSLVQEVCLYGSSPKYDAAQSGSPKTPTLSHFTAQHISQFVESFIRAFPSESDELFILLDAFQERRFVVKFCLFYCYLFNCQSVFVIFCRTNAICMRISSFLEKLNTKHDESGLSHVIKDISARFLEFGSRVSQFC